MCTLLKINDVDCLIIYLFTTHLSSLINVQIFCPFKKIGSLLPNWELFVYSEYKSFLFSLSYSLKRSFFVFVCFLRGGCFWFWLTIHQSFLLWAIFDIASENFFLTQRSQRFYPRSFKVFGYTFRSMIHFDTIFICSLRYRLKFSFFGCG